MADLIELALAVIIGGTITVLASRRYYMKASEDLREHYQQASGDLERNTDALKRLITIHALYMHREGLLKEPPELDDRGHLKLDSIDRLGTLSLTASLGDVQESEREEPGPDPEDAPPKDERGGA